MKILHQELIGKYVRVIDSKNKTLLGVSGNVVDETQQTIVLDTGKVLLKSQVKLEIEKEVIEGASLIGRAEERLKKRK